MSTPFDPTPTSSPALSSSKAPLHPPPPHPALSIFDVHDAGVVEVGGGGDGFPDLSLVEHVAATRLPPLGRMGSGANGGASAHARALSASASPPLGASSSSAAAAAAPVAPVSPVPDFFASAEQGLAIQQQESSARAQGRVLTNLQPRREHEQEEEYYENEFDNEDGNGRRGLDEVAEELELGGEDEPPQGESTPVDFEEVGHDEHHAADRDGDNDAEQQYEQYEQGYDRDGDGVSHRGVPSHSKSVAEEEEEVYLQASAAGAEASVDREREHAAHLEAVARAHLLAKVQVGDTFTKFSTGVFGPKGAKKFVRISSHGDKSVAHRTYAFCCWLIG
jgi:hypothetical protein